MKKHRYPGFIPATLELDIDDFNRHVLHKIRVDAMAHHPSRPCYIVESDDILVDAAQIAGENIVVLPLYGVTSEKLDYETPDICSQVHPRSDGARIAVLMLAAGDVALTHMAPHWADASLGDNLNVLWLFDDEPVVSQYRICDDLIEQMTETNAIEEDHHPLTQEEVQAWQRVAAEATHIGFFEVLDLTDPACPQRDAILTA